MHVLTYTHTHTTTPLTLLVTKYLGVPLPPTKQFKSILTPSPRRWHWVPQARVPPRLSPPQMPVTSAACHLCFWWTSGPSEVPATPCSGLINLLGWLTELRKAHLPAYQRKGQRASLPQSWRVSPTQGGLCSPMWTPPILQPVGIWGVLCGLTHVATINY